MRQEVPKCSVCRAEREAARAYEKSASAKGKPKVKGGMIWGDEEEEENEWGGGEPGIMKVSYFLRLMLEPWHKLITQPDITFFGQALDSKFDECLFKDREKVDLLVIIGTSLKVAPVSEVCSMFSPHFLHKTKLIDSSYTSFYSPNLHQSHPRRSCTARCKTSVLRNQVPSC